MQVLTMSRVVHERPCSRVPRLSVWIVLASLVCSAVAASDIPVQQRLPSAAVVNDDWLYVANRRSGTISCVHIPRRQLVTEHHVAESCSDIKLLSGGRNVVVTDARAHCVRILAVNSEHINELQRLDVPRSPEQAAVSADGKTMVVSSRWSRRLTVLDANHPVRVRGIIDLPFAPHKVLILPGLDQAVVASAFRGEFATVDLVGLRIVSLSTLDGHNIRGMALSQDGQRLFVAHQIANPIVPTVRERIFWGAVIGNQLRAIPVSELVPSVDDRDSVNPPVTNQARIGRWTLYALGEPGRGAGDPSAVAVGPKGRLCVLTSGTNELHVRQHNHADFLRIPVGTHPVDVVLSEDGSEAYVVNEFDGSVSFVNLDSARVEQTVSLGPSPEPTIIDRGRELFFNSRLSLDGWYSCHSCHTDGHTNGRTIDNLSDSTGGTPKQIPSLQGVVETPPWAWNGRQHGLGEQVAASIQVTMRGDPAGASLENIDAIVAFMQSLEPIPSITEARSERNESFNRRVERGRAEFEALGCIDCHRPWTYSSDLIVDVDLVDEAGHREFNPPSLRAVSQRGPYYHDGRAPTLKSVLTTHRHAGLEELTDEQLNRLLDFLRSL